MSIVIHVLLLLHVCIYHAKSEDSPFNFFILNDNHFVILRTTINVYLNL